MGAFCEQIVKAQAGCPWLFWAGQAGFVIKAGDGTTIAIDLCLSDCVERFEGHMGFKRLVPAVMDPGEMEFDCIIATHQHWDHFDVDSMPAMMRAGERKALLLASNDCYSLVKECELDESCVRFVAPGDVCEVGDVLIRFVACDHGAAAPGAVGMVFEFDGLRVYMAGDTCLRLDQAAAILAFGHVDVLIGPINGRFGNMSENDLARLGDAVDASLVIPCHYGMFASHGGSPLAFMQAMSDNAPQRSFYLMTLSEGIDLKKMLFAAEEA